MMYRVQRRKEQKTELRTYHYHHQEMDYRLETSDCERTRRQGSRTNGCLVRSGLWGKGFFLCERSKVIKKRIRKTERISAATHLKMRYVVGFAHSYPGAAHLPGGKTNVLHPYRYGPPAHN